MTQKLINFKIHERMKQDIAATAKAEGVTLTEFIKLSVHHYRCHLSNKKPWKSPKDTARKSLRRILKRVRDDVVKNTLKKS